MKLAIIGGTGHIGSYLTPMAVEAGHEVTCVCRGLQKPYRPHELWNRISYLRIDRTAEEEKGTFGDEVASLKADVVIDLTCYFPRSAEQLAKALDGRIRQLLHCGTIWVHGHSTSVPTPEDRLRRPFGDYGIRKAAIEEWLLRQSRDEGLPVTILHPGHLVGPGWAPINPVGNFDPGVFAALRCGEEVRIPNFGMETVHHVHAEDVARAFLLAIEHPEAALGESFHIVSGAALTLRGYAEEMSEWFGHPARLCFLPWEQWKQGVSARAAAITEDHIRHSPNCSIEKARSLLEYEPHYTSLKAVQEAVGWLIANGIVS
jgi:nucleoside-diphosphate-sugar epimerase